MPRVVHSEHLLPPRSTTAAVARRLRRRGDSTQRCAVSEARRHAAGLCLTQSTARVSRVSGLRPFQAGRTRHQFRDIAELDELLRSREQELRRRLNPRRLDSSECGMSGDCPRAVAGVALVAAATRTKPEEGLNGRATRSENDVLRPPHHCVALPTQAGAGT